MNARSVAIALIIVILTFDARSRAADPPKTAEPVQRTVKLITTTSENSAQYILVTPPEGGAAIKLLLTGDARNKYSSLFMLRGELIDITVKPGGQATDMVTAVSKFNGPREMKSPKAFVFDGMGEQKIGQQTLTIVKLSRFGQTKEAAIPNRPVAGGGKAAPDPVLLERLKNVKTGDVIEVDLAPGAARGTFMLVDVDTFREPQVGEFVKLDTLKENGKSLPAIVLNVNDDAQTIALPSGSPLRPTEAAAVAMARKLKPGNYVRFTAREDGGHSTLRDLRIDGSMEPTYNNRYEFVSTFIRIQYYTYGADIDVYYYPRAGRPDDQIIEKGLRQALYSSSEAGRLGLSGDQVQQFKKILETRLEGVDSDDLMAREKMRWVKAYKAWNSARDEAERAGIEQQMAFAAQDVAGRWRKDIEGKFTILKSLLDTKQLEEVRKLGKKAPGSFE